MTTKSPQPSAIAPDGDAQNPQLVRILKIAVIGMGLLIVLGLGAVIWRIVHLASSPKPASMPAAASSPAQPRSETGQAALAPEIELDLPANAAVRAVTMSGSRMAVHFEAPSGTGIAIVDLESGRTVSRVQLKSP